MPSIDLTEVLIAFAVLLASLSVHEAAHAWTAWRLGDPTARLLGRVSLNPAVHVDPIGTLLFPLIAIVTGLPVIGWAKPVPVNVHRLANGRRDFLLVAAAGPASNLALAVLAALAWRVIGPGAAAAVDPGNPVLLFVYILLNLNVLLAVFNMIPIPPLDGGNVLAGILPDRLAEAFDRLRPYGFLVLYGLMLTGVLWLIISPPMRFIRSWLI
ncbi:MAG TPA: site-2 protease family protein [Vicinamibacterales bacterium]|nr:site-2 protease family protein [Vicinamibacterales bacterium]